MSDAARNLLIQNLALTWRYSVGNRYEQLSTPEAVDVARVLGAYGHLAVSRTMLRTAMPKQPARPLRRSQRRTNWRIGARLVGVAHYASLAGDDAEVVRATPTLRRYVRVIGEQLRKSRNGLLPRERFSSDVATACTGCTRRSSSGKGCARWRMPGGRGLHAARRRVGAPRAQARKGAPPCDPPLAAAAAERSAVRPGAVARGGRSVPGADTTRVAGATGISSCRTRWRPDSSRRAGRTRPACSDTSNGTARASSASHARAPTASTARARRASPARIPCTAQCLALSRRQRPRRGARAQPLRAARGRMTPGTFVSGESVSIAPLDGRLYRSTYLPPNTASNAAFLETLRLLVVHETLDRRGAPRSRAGLLDSAGVARAGERDRGAWARDELRAALVLRRRGGVRRSSLDPRPRERAPPQPATTPTAARRTAHPRSPRRRRTLGRVAAGRRDDRAPDAGWPPGGRGARRLSRSERLGPDDGSSVEHDHSILVLDRRSQRRDRLVLARREHLDLGRDLVARPDRG